MSTDWEAEGLLEGLDDEAREARRALLDELVDQGVEIDQLRQATEEGRLALVPLERQLGGEPHLTAADVVERTGLERDFLDSLWRSLGMPLAEEDERAYTDGDVEAAKAVGRSREGGIPDEGIFEIARALSQSMATVAAAIGRVFGDAFLRPGDTERDIALRYSEATRELAPDLAPAVLNVLAIQLREDVRRAAVDPSQALAGGQRGAEQLTVCFADLVGFTRLGERIPPDELGAVAGRLAELATEVAQPPVRLVKTIGDAVMLASHRTDPLLDAALELVAAGDPGSDDLPELRAGVAAGSALRRGGDWYGPPVNLASRLTGIARPGSVLVAEEVRDAVDGDYQWSFAGERNVRGVGPVKTFRVRPADDQAD